MIKRRIRNRKKRNKKLKYKMNYLKYSTEFEEFYEHTFIRGGRQIRHT